jgi:hypothetical protein
MIPQNRSCEILNPDILATQVSTIRSQFSSCMYDMKSFFLLSGLSCLLSSVVSTPHPQPRDYPSVSTIYKFPNKTWIEIAVRSNGNLFTTLITTPELWEIEPFPSKADLIHCFDTVTSVFGIPEVECDLFAVALGNWSYHHQVQPGTWSIWSLDLRAVDNMKVQKVTDIPEAHYLEGITALPSSPGIILSADSALGLIYCVNIFTGDYSVAIRNDALKPAKDAIVPVGVNDIHVSQNH